MGADHIADAAHGMDQGLGLILVDLLAQAADLHVDHPGLGVEVIVPHPFQQHASRDHLILVADKEFQQAKFPGLQGDGLAAPFDLAVAQVQLEVGDDQLE